MTKGVGWRPAGEIDLTAEDLVRRARRHQLCDALGWVLLILALLALILTLCIAEGAGTAPRRYTRHGGAYYTIRNGGYSIHVAQRLLPKAPAADLQWLAKEVAVLNQASLHYRWQRGDRLRVPIYKPWPHSHYMWGTAKAWFHAVKWGARYGVPPALLIAIATHEGGNWETSNRCGVRGYSGYYAEFREAAEIVRGFQDRCFGGGRIRVSQGWCERLGHHYKTGRYGGRAGPWAKCVYTIWLRAQGRIA